MPVRVRIYGQEAVFQQGCWVCEDESLGAMLEALTDPRAMTPEEEERYAVYCAGRYGGQIYRGQVWEAAPYPEPEIRIEDIAPRGRPEKAGWLSFLKRRS